eukprot:6020486-Pleurochrysis_carterae.AAC.6
MHLGIFSSCTVALLNVVRLSYVISIPIGHAQGSHTLRARAARPLGRSAIALAVAPWYEREPAYTAGFNCCNY